VRIRLTQSRCVESPLKICAVYDVTKFLDDHPGGPDIISDGAGQDLTDQFEDTGHSQDARKDMEKYLVGSLAAGDDDGKKKANKKGSSGASQSSTATSGATNPYLLVAIGIAVIAGVYLLISNPN